MAVPEQIPYVGYIGNGTATEFPITFDLHDQGYLVVTQNKEIPAVGAYTVDMNALKVVFATAPKQGDQIELYRDTQLNRDTNYKSYDNSFRPETVNWDFDKIIHILQEQHMIDAELAARLKGEIEWRRTHDANFDELAMMRDAQVFSGLKGYVDTFIAATNPNIFGGITAGIVFALDQKSVQTHLEIIYEMLANNRTDFEGGLEEEKQRALQAEIDLQTDINAENTRATGAESTLNTKIDNETNRALGIEQSLQLQISTSNAGIKYFQTEAALLATTPGTTDPKQAYAFDTKKNYLWNGSAWVGEGKSQYDLAVDFVNANPNFKFQTIATGIYFDTYKTPGQFAISTTNFQASTSKPNTTVGGVLIVYGSGAGYLTAQEYRSYNNEVFFRFFTNVWSAWSTLAKLSDFNAKSIASAADFDTYKSIGQFTITGTILIASSHAPPVTVGGVLSVDGSGADYLTSQRFTTWTNEVYTRALTNVWSPWKKLAFNSDFDLVAITAGIDFDTYKTQKTYSVTNIAIQASTHAPASTFGGILRVIGTGANYLTQQIYIDYKGVYFYRALEVNWTPWFKLVTSDVTDNLAQQIANIQTPNTGLTGKKWLAVGDSITVGLNATKSYADVLAERYSATLTKHATSGAWISAGTGTITIPNILSQTYTSLSDSANYDVITIAAGTNDRINGTDGNLGTFDDRTTATFYGALHTLIAGLKTKYPNARMLFMSQTPRSGLRTNPTTPTDLDKKFKAITEVCDYYAVPVFAGHKCFDFHPDDNATFKSTYMPDGLHPSDSGHVWFANRLEQTILSVAK